MKPNKETKSRLVIAFRRETNLARERNGDYNVAGTVIKGETVADYAPIMQHPQLTFKDGAMVHPTLIQAVNTQEWCLKVWYNERDWILIPVNVIHQTEETSVSTFR